MSDNTDNIQIKASDLSAQLWSIANDLRGGMDANEFRNYILGTIFYRYLSERTENYMLDLLKNDNISYEEAFADETYKPVVEKWSIDHLGYIIRPDNLFRELNRKVIKPAGDDDRFNVEDYERAVNELTGSTLGQKSEAAFSGLFDDMRLQDTRLGDTVSERTDKIGKVIAKIGEIEMDLNDSDFDVLGTAYMILIGLFQSGAGKKGGEFFTPSCVVRTLVEVLQPYKGRVYDPCCGSGGMFVQSAKFVENHSGNINNIAIYGQDSNPTTWKMAQMNLAIRGIEPDLGTYAADTFLDDRHPTMRADFIMANPPFNLSDWGADKLKDDVRWQYGMPPAGNANFAWLQHMIYHLAPAGKIGMVLANGSLSSQSGGEGEIRKNIINADLVECIIAMPTQLFYTTQIPVSLWFLNKQKKQPGKTLFIDARKLGTMVSRKLRELTEDDIQKIANTYKTFIDGTLEDEKGYCAVVSTEEIAKQDYILTPGRYVGIEEQEDDGEPFEEKMTRLTSELSKLFEKSHELEAEIRKKLGAIGYEI